MIKFEFSSDENDHYSHNKLLRLVNSDKAYSLLWDIDQECCKALKYDTNYDKVLEKIHEIISEERILEYYD